MVKVTITLPNFPPSIGTKCLSIYFILGGVQVKLPEQSFSQSGNRQETERRTQDEGDGNLLCVFVTVHGKFLEQPLLMFGEDEPAAQMTQTSQ